MSESTPLLLAAFPPSVRTDAAGNAVAVWIEPVANFFDSVLKSARFDKLTGRWSAPVTMSSGVNRRIVGQQLFVDGAGNAVVTWTSAIGFGSYQAEAARYSVGAGTWTSVLLPSSTGSSGGPLVAGNPAGDAVIVWTDQTFASAGIPPRVVGIRASRFSSSSGTWSSPEPLTAALPQQPAPSAVAMDGAGNIHVVWTGSNRAQTMRFVAATAAWEPVIDLSDANVAESPQLVMNAAGDAVAVWLRLGTIEAAIFSANGTAWTAPVVVGLTADAQPPSVAVDADGDAVVAWTSTEGADRLVLTARYSAATSAWSPPLPMVDNGALSEGPRAAIDPAGNAFVVWSIVNTGGYRLLAARYLVSTSTWLTSDLSPAGPGNLGLDVAADGAGNATILWTQAGANALATRALRWTATPAAPVVTNVLPRPGGLRVSFTATMTSDPVLTPSNVEYSLDGGTTWLARLPASVASPLEIGGLTDGVTYSLRLRALNAAGAGDASVLIPVRSGTDITPTDFRVVARTGNTVTFAWVPPAAGIVPDGYLIEGGLAGQTQVLATVPTGGAATQISLAVPSGLFFVRVVALRGTTRLGQSAELQLGVNASAFPSTPTNLLGSAVGQRLTLSWANSLNSDTATGVRLDVSGSITTAIDLPVTEHIAFDGVPPGTYTFTVTPLVASVPGDSSNTVTLTFPGTCPVPPSPPTAFSLSTQGGRVYLDWLPPASGPAVTSYVVHATGAFTGSFPLTVRTFSAGVAPGSYTVSITAVGPCGTSEPTATQTVVVP